VISCSICGYFTIGMLTLSQSHFLKGTVISFQSMAFFSGINRFEISSFPFFSFSFSICFMPPFFMCQTHGKRALCCQIIVGQSQLLECSGNRQCGPAPESKCQFFSSFSENRIPVAVQLLSCQILSFQTGI
jgi:hypothetical protein